MFHGFEGSFSDKYFSYKKNFMLTLYKFWVLMVASNESFIENLGLSKDDKNLGMP